MTVYVKNVRSVVVDELVLPKLRQLAGADGHVHRLSEAEVGAAMLQYLHYKTQMTSQSKAVGNMGIATDI